MSLLQKRHPWFNHRRWRRDFLSFALLPLLSVRIKSIVTEWSLLDSLLTRSLQCFYFPLDEDFLLGVGRPRKRKNSCVAMRQTRSITLWPLSFFLCLSLFLKRSLSLSGFFFVWLFLKRSLSQAFSFSSVLFLKYSLSLSGSFSLLLLLSFSHILFLTLTLSIFYVFFLFSFLPLSVTLCCSFTKILSTPLIYVSLKLKLFLSHQYFRSKILFPVGCGYFPTVTSDYCVEV